MALTTLKNPPMLAFQEVSDDRVIEQLTTLNKWVSALAKFVKENHVDFPEIYEIMGKVNIQSLPDIKVSNLYEIGQFFKGIESQLSQISMSLMSLKSGSSSDQGNSEMMMRMLAKGFSSLEKSIQTVAKKFEEQKIVTVDSTGMPPEFIETLGHIEDYSKKMYEMELGKPTFVAPPVTNININALQGSYLNTQVTVGTSITALPHDALANRRALIVYNNSSATTVYIGNNNVTTTNGLPIPAKSFGPSLEAGVNMGTLFGIVSTGSADCRVLEISNNAKGM